MDSLRELLVGRAKSRVVVSNRLSLSALALMLGLMSISLWAAISLNNRIQSSSLYGPFGIYAALLLLCVYYTGLNFHHAKNFSTRPVEVSSDVRAWNKRAYKFLIALVVFEHGVFFTSLPVMVYHSLGLSLSSCISHREPCTGISYETWITVSSKSKTTRVQNLVSVPISIELTTSQLAVFGSFISALGLGLIILGIYLYSESSRRSVTLNTIIFTPKTRLYLIFSMAIISTIQLILSLIGMFSVISCNWFILPLILSVVLSKV